MNIIKKSLVNIKSFTKNLFNSTGSKIGLSLFVSGLFSYILLDQSATVVKNFSYIGVICGAIVIATAIVGQLLEDKELENFTNIPSLKWLSISGAFILISFILSIFTLPVFEYLSLTFLLTGSILSSLLFIYTSFVTPVAWATKMIEEGAESEEEIIEDNKDSDETEKEIEHELELTYYFKK